MEKQQRVFGASHPIDEDLLAALADMPDASGVALGFDRLIRLATGVKRVETLLCPPPLIQSGLSQRPNLLLTASYGYSICTTLVRAPAMSEATERWLPYRASTFGKSAGNYPTPPPTTRINSSP